MDSTNNHSDKDFVATPFLEELYKLNIRPGTGEIN